MDYVFLVWYLYSWVDFDYHREKKLVGVFDTPKKAEKARKEWETLATFHLYSDKDKKVIIEKIPINKTILTEEYVEGWYD